VIANDQAATVETAANGRTELRDFQARNFRNLTELSVVFPPDGVVIVGENGQGKTNLLEAVRYLTVLRSARGASDAELVRHGAEGFFLMASAHTNSDRRVAVGFERASKEKRVSVDGVNMTRMSDAFGTVAAILLSPADVQLISGGPSSRRRYMDLLLSLGEPRYLAALQRYRGALLRRNTLLRDAFRTQGADSQVAAWEPLLAESGAVLWRMRREWADMSREEYSNLCSRMGEEAKADMLHVIHGAPPSLDAASLQQLLESHRATDIRSGRTSVGPHRDDLRLTLGARELRLFGSGGQQRTAALALRLLETFTLRDRLGRWPVLLLDDPFAELDARRGQRILQLVEERGYGQVVLAVPREDDVPSGFTGLGRWRMTGGRIDEG
jgi:DNA replication and repair protein RecF